MEVRKERTGWRDEELSRRHRMWGWDCPALDIDFLLLEYDKGKPVAIIEYKNENAAPQYPNHPSYRALIDLGNRANIPVIAFRYATDFSKFTVTPLNRLAFNFVQTKKKEMNEENYLKLLYQMRGKNDVPQEVLNNIGVVL